MNWRPVLGLFSHLSPVGIEVHMTHRLLHAKATLVEAFAVSVDNINKPVWSRVK